MSSGMKGPAVGVMPPARSGAYIFVDDESTEVKTPPATPSLSPTPAPAGTLPSLTLDGPPTMKDASQTIISMRYSSKKELRMILGASYQVSSGASGITNQVVQVANIANNPDFTSFAALFNEFFVTKMEVTYEPQSRYNKQATAAGVRQVTDVPLVVAELQHAQPVYANHADACNNGGLKICNSADPWKVTWVNDEKKSSAVLPTPAITGALPTQSWCSTDVIPASLYTGQLQILSPASIPNSINNYLYGTVVVRWEVFFRSRF